MLFLRKTARITLRWWQQGTYPLAHNLRGQLSLPITLRMLIATLYSRNLAETNLGLMVISAVLCKPVRCVIPQASAVPSTPRRGDVRIRALLHVPLSILSACDFGRHFSSTKFFIAFRPTPYQRHSSDLSAYRGDFQAHTCSSVRTTLEIVVVTE
jgi:small-conductance mechanosensitive channel